MVGGIGAPRAPHFGAPLEATGVECGHAALLAGVAQAKIRRRKGVGVTERAHGDI